MQIVISIDDELYQMCKDLHGDADIIERAIANGIPLLAGHGDLIDKQDFINVIRRDIELYTEWNEIGNACGLDIAVDRAECMDVIVKADGGSEE